MKRSPRATAQAEPPRQARIITIDIGEQEHKVGESVRTADGLGWKWVQTHTLRGRVVCSIDTEQLRKVLVARCQSGKTPLRTQSGRSKLLDGAVVLIAQDVRKEPVAAQP
jgi:hypothetical protein